MLNQSQLEKLLGRSLTTLEVTNLTLYLDNSIDVLERLLCTKIRKADNTTRKYLAHKGYSTVWTDILRAVTSVEVDGVANTDYTKMFFDDMNASVYNSLVFDDKFYCNKTIEVTGNWGYDQLPGDLSVVLARLFALNTKSQKSDGRVQSKQVEDFRISYKDVTLDEQFLDDNAVTLSKYSQCNLGRIDSGDIPWRLSNVGIR